MFVPSWTLQKGQRLSYLQEIHEEPSWRLEVDLTEGYNPESESGRERERKRERARAKTEIDVVLMHCSRRSSQVRPHEVAMRQSRPCKCNRAAYVFGRFSLSLHCCSSMHLVVPIYAVQDTTADGQDPALPIIRNIP